jgi:hypothetical protein
LATDQAEADLVFRRLRVERWELRVKTSETNLGDQSLNSQLSSLNFEVF